MGFWGDETHLSKTVQPDSSSFDKGFRSIQSYLRHTCPKLQLYDSSLIGDPIRQFH